MPKTVLPLPATRLFGREAELRLVGGLLDDSRLVTLTGAGGCGKTRLALTVASDVSERYDGVHWVDLAPLTDEALVAKSVGAALHLADRPGADAIDWLGNAIGDRRLLLVLDNCEHLVEGCAQLVARLLPRCPCLTVLATSREPLGVAGETSYRVPSLAVPPADAGADDVRHFPAVALFTDRAAKAQPGFALTPDNATAVAEISRRLDGIPLALELAASRVRMMTPRQIADALGDRFQLLTGGVRTALPRQRTLEASVAWSYDLLGDDERCVLRRLAAFTGSFSLESALGVCDAGPPVLDVLGRLVERSLLQVDDLGEMARYRLLETVRAFVLVRLVEAGEVVDARNRHLAVYVDLAERSEAAILTPDVITVLDTLDAEADNLRAAMDWAQASEQLDKALRIGGSLWLYWFIRTRHGEGLTRLYSLLDAAPDAEPRLRFRVIVAALMLAMSTDLKGSLPLAEEATTIADAVGDDRMRSQALAWLGNTLHLLNSGDPGEPLAESLRLARSSGDVAQIGRSLHWYGIAKGMQGDPDGGMALLDEAIELFRATGNVLQLGWALIFRGIGGLTSGDLADGVAHLSEAHELLTARGETTFSAFALSELATASLLRGDLETAQRQLDQAIAVSRVCVAPMLEAQATAYRALLDYARGHDTEARALSLHAFDLVAQSGCMLMAGQVLSLAGCAALRLGDPEAARDEISRAIQHTDRLPMFRARALWAQAQLAQADGSVPAAVDLVHESLRLASSIRELGVGLDALDLLAGLIADTDPQSAVRLLGASERGHADSGYVRFPSHVDEHNRVVRRLQRALGEDFDALWAEGAQLSFAEAAAYAARGRGPRQRPSTGWESLTPMERDVAALVAKGLSNPDIAAQLFVSRNTVKAHLAHTYAKLGISTRSELAAEVSRRDLTQDGART